MERVEQLLRDELRRTEARGGAPADVLLARVARVRRRRTAMVGAGAGMAAVLAGAALIGPLGPGGRAPAGAEPELPPVVYSNTLLRALFTDADHGYVLQRRCATTFPEGTAFVGAETPPTEHDCAARLVATADGGRSWQRRTLPADPTTPDKYRDPAGRSLAFWLADRDTIAVSDRDDRHWTSDDGGRRWTEAPAAVGAPGTVGVVGPRDERVYLAQSADGFPPDKEGGNPVAAATDGSFWWARSGEPGAGFTRDRGVTWEVTPNADFSADWVATYDGQTIYAAAGPAVLRSTDRGTTWTEVTRLDSSEISVAGVVMPDGVLVLADGRDGHLFRLAAGATQLERLPDVPVTISYLYRSGDWLVAYQGPEQREGDPDLGPVVAVSPDNGTTWQAIAPPPA